MKNVASIVIAVTMVLVAGCRQHSQDADIGNGTVEEVAGPFMNATDFSYYHDFEEVDGRLYILAETKPPYYTVSHGILFINDDVGTTMAPAKQWSYVGSPMTNSLNVPNPKGSLAIRFPYGGNKDVGFLISNSAGLYGPTPTATINSTTSGGWTWTPSITNIQGVIDGVNGTWDGVNGLVLTEYGGNAAVPFLKKWDAASQQYGNVMFPVSPTTPGGRLIGRFDKHLEYFTDTMDSEIWVRQSVGRGAWDWVGPLFSAVVTAPAPVYPLEVLSATTGPFVPTSQAALGSDVIPPLSLGRYGLRRSTGYEQYPADVATPVMGAYVNGKKAWLVDAAETVWYSQNQGARWHALYNGRYPRFFTDKKATSRVFFADGKQGMWILSEGTHLLLHKYNKYN